MRYDKRSALALFICGLVCAGFAIAVAVREGRGSNPAFLEGAAFFFCLAWIIERIQGRKGR
jgi:hypothetical protein